MQNYFYFVLIKYYFLSNGVGLLNYQSISKIMTHPVVTLNEIEKVKRVMEVLSSTTHNGFPVIGKDGSLTFLVKFSEHNFSRSYFCQSKFSLRLLYEFLLCYCNTLRTLFISEIF